MTTTANRTDPGDKCADCRRANLVESRPGQPHRLICPACGNTVNW